MRNFYLSKLCLYHLVNLLSDCEHGRFALSAGVEGESLTEYALDSGNYLLLGVEALAELHCAHILERVVEDYDSERLVYLAVGSGIYREGVTCGYPMLTAHVGEGLDFVNGELVVVEVVAPLKEADDIVLIHLHTDGTVTPGGHGDESVGYVDSLTAAVVGPEVGYVVVDELLDVVVAGDGKVYDAHLEELVVGERVHNNVAVENVLNCVLCRLVGLEVVELRLVGDTSLSITNSWGLPKLMSTEAVMPSNHLMLCRSLLLLPPIPPSISLFQ